MDHEKKHGSSLNNNAINVLSPLILPASSSNIVTASGGAGAAVQHHDKPVTISSPPLPHAIDATISNMAATEIGNKKMTATVRGDTSVASKAKSEEEKTPDNPTGSSNRNDLEALSTLESQPPPDVTLLQRADSNFMDDTNNRFRFASDEVRPGAVRVPGINGVQQTRFIDQDEEEDEDEGTTLDDTAPVPSSVVAEVVDEKQLLHELLSRHQNDVVEAENVVSVAPVVDGSPSAEYDKTSGAKNEGDDNNRGTEVPQPKYFTKKKVAAGILIAAFVIAAVVVTAVVISLSKKQKKSPRTSSATPATAPTSHPSSAPLSRQEMLRALLLNLSASSQQNLDQPSTPQYQALNWLANFDGATLNIGMPDVETIIERFVLAVLYYGNGGFKWASTCDFLSNSSVCEWHDTSGNGTFCTMINAKGSNGTGRVTELILDGNFLSGVIATELGMLSSLTLLDLGRNALHGTIPTELGQLSSLTKLYLGNNELKGPIPTELGRLVNLTVLYLASNQLTGTIPAELGALSSLTDLSLGDHNQLTGTIPSVLGGLSSLANLNFAYNQLSGTLPTELARLTNLTDLQISNVPLTGTIPTELGQLYRLTGLGIWATHFHGTIPTELGALSSLVFLSLDGSNLSGKIPTEFGNLGGLFVSFLEMSLCCNSLTGSLPTELAHLSNVQKLRFDQNQLTGTIPTEVAALSDLDELYLSQNDFVGTLTPFFCNNRSIPWLSFWADCSTGNVVCDCCRCF